MVSLDTELLASIIASTPVPPLPQLVLRGDDNVDSTCSSHDTLASMLVHVVQLNDAVANKNRHDRQMAILVKYQREFGELVTSVIENQVVDTNTVYKMIYGKFCSYTREHVAAYLPQKEDCLGEAQISDLRFMPHDIACSYKHGSSLFDKTHQHLCALIDILNTENEAASLPIIKKPIATKTSYDEMIYMYAIFAWV